jgi:hypothetical protein
LASQRTTPEQQESFAEREQQRNVNEAHHQTGNDIGYPTAFKHDNGSSTSEATEIKPGRILSGNKQTIFVMTIVVEFQAEVALADHEL